ncbi:MAG TPA: dissimilatory-type sulfite reductase subunit alpha [bacterium]|nr:dissimilatory-type sulfite reductase subunit alpha [bacterium]HQO33181.1 dissimilatory-type sulfite reductase subunit alpha [bacterium]HQP97362.1 dissimilatory-type sulfite reductase subunit alpha [bacterium]
MGDATKEYPTPLLDELEKGEWPSFVKEIKAAAKTSRRAQGLLGQLETSYEEKIGHWKHGGIVGVLGYGGGVIGRYSDIPEKFPDVAHFHTLRVNMPTGWFYTSDVLRKLCDIWDRHGSGLTNMHGSTGDIILLGTTTPELEPVFSELTELGFDLGGSGSDTRTPSACVGPARCEWACYDTLALCYDLTMTFQDEIHRPAFPYKFKIKCAGCPNDCVASIARADLSIIGTWRDEIQIDKDALAEYARKGVDIQSDVVNLCPGKCIRWDGRELDIDNSACVHCMHCINVLPKALAPGKDRGACILLGSKAPIVEGALLSSVIVPFMKIEPPYKDLKDLVEKIWDVWCEDGKSRERIGEFIQRVGMGNFLEAIEVEPSPYMVAHPRENPYVFYEEYFEEGDED